MNPDCLMDRASKAFDQFYARASPHCHTLYTPLNAIEFDLTRQSQNSAFIIRDDRQSMFGYTNLLYTQKLAMMYAAQAHKPMVVVRFSCRKDFLDRLVSFDTQSSERNTGYTVPRFSLRDLNAALSGKIEMMSMHSSPVRPIDRR